MEDISKSSSSEFSTGKKLRKNLKRDELYSEKAKNNHGIDKLISEGDGNFFNYFNRLGNINELNLLVLPSSNHYYYDESDMKGVTTLINLKELNLIDHLDSFVKTVYDVLPPKTSFIGCFYEKKTQMRTAFFSRMYKKFINFLDARVDNEIDQRDVARLLESHDYKIIDMTEINGKTYFMTQN
jgi:hypothetical protein